MSGHPTIFISLRWVTSHSHWLCLLTVTQNCRELFRGNCDQFLLLDLGSLQFQRVAADSWSELFRLDRSHRELHRVQKICVIGHSSGMWSHWQFQYVRVCIQLELVSVNISGFKVSVRFCVHFDMCLHLLRHLCQVRIGVGSNRHIHFKSHYTAASMPASLRQFSVIFA